MNLFAKTQLAVLIAFATVSISNSAFANREGDVALLSRQCGTVVGRDGQGTRVYMVAEAVRTQLVGGFQDICYVKDQDIAAYCRNWGNENSEISQRCYQFQNTHPAIVATPPQGQQQVCPQNLLGRSGETASELRQNINLFMGDEISGTTGINAGIRNQFFRDCVPLPNTAEGLIQEDLTSPGAASCASMAILQCGGQRLQGFHLTRTSTSPIRYRLHTAAHIVNTRSKRVMAQTGSTTGIYDFSQCELQLASGGPSLAGVTLGQVQFRDAAMRRLVESQPSSSVFGLPENSSRDIAWFDITPNGNEQILSKVALPIYSGSISGLANARVCSVGHFGGEPTTVNRCISHGIGVSGGNLRTRTPMVLGMSGGAYVTKIGDQNYALGVISAEWNPNFSGDAVVAEPVPGTGGSSVLEFQSGRENLGVRY